MVHRVKHLPRKGIKTKKTLYYFNNRVMVSSMVDLTGIEPVSKDDPTIASTA